jgi:hypothetical protein
MKEYLLQAKGVLLTNADNHVSRHRILLVPVNGMLISSEAAFFQRPRKCLVQARGYLA